MVRSAVKVVLRTRPSSSFAASNIDISDDDQTLNLYLNKQDHLSRLQQEHYQFKFDHVLHDATQEATFSVCALDIIRSAIAGYNGTIMAYGQTGAGKTYTMTGKGSTFENRGITPRAIGEVFHGLRENDRSLAAVRVSYVEIYNEGFYDLLRPGNDASPISVVEDPKGGVSLKGAECRVMANEADALSALFEGETSRAIAQHQMNNRSSRSHCIFTMYIESRSSSESEEITSSKLHLVDLAGSERVAKTGSTGQVLREATHINKSLAFLEQVIVALSEKNRDHVPYRSSKLTHLLKGSLGGNCKTLMIANIWGELSHLEETLSTCRFAQRMARVSNEAVLNTRQDPQQLLRKCEREIQDLKAELAMHDQFASRSAVNYGDYSESQREQLRAQVLRYYASGEPLSSFDPLELTSLRHVKEILIQCKLIHQEQCGGQQLRQAASVGAAQARSTSSGLVGTNRSQAFHATARQPKPPSGDAVDCVGDLEEDPRMMAIPAAPDDDFLPSPDPPEIAVVRTAIPASGSQEPSAGGMRPERRPPVSSEDALAEFKSGPGKELAEAMLENKKALRAAKLRQKEISLTINATKKEIDSLREAAEAAPSSAAEVEVDEETYQALLRLKAIKAQYREDYRELQMVKSEVEYTTRLLDSCSSEMSAAFEQWFRSEFRMPQTGMPEATGHKTQTLPLANDPPTHTLTAIATMEQQSPSRMARPAKSQAQPLASSPEASAYYAAQARTSGPVGINSPQKIATRARGPGTFGSGPKIGGGKTNMDVDRLKK